MASSNFTYQSEVGKYDSMVCEDANIVRLRMPENKRKCTESTHISNVIVASDTDEVSNEKNVNVFSGVIVTFEDGDEETLNREGTGHHRGKSCHSCTDCRHGVGTTGSAGHNPNQKYEVSYDTDDSVTHKMRSKLEIFEDQTPSNQKDGVDCSVDVGERIGRNETFPLDDYEIVVENEQK